MTACRRSLARTIVAGCAAWLAASGCSDRSRLLLTIERITADQEGTKQYIEADLFGSAEDACLTLQEPAFVQVRLEGPGTVGPQFDAVLTNYTVEFFYFDPADGLLKGPVGLLALRQANLGQRLQRGTASTLQIPVATYVVKTWSYGIACSGITPYPGPGVVDRMLARITVSGEDLTGAALSASGGILVLLYDYGPAPVAGDACYVNPPPSTYTRVASLCP
jgi:hypothetical protein